MSTADALSSAWSRFVVASSYEQDPGFRQVILGLSKKGLYGVGAIGIGCVLFYLGTHLLFLDRPLTWRYGTSPQAIVLWDKLLVLLVSLLAAGLASRPGGARWGRLVVALMIVAVAAAFLVDDIIGGNLMMSSIYLVLLMLTAVGTMPYRAGQMLALCVGIIGLYLLALLLYPVQPGAGWLGIVIQRMISLSMPAIICTGISGLLYRGRYEQHLALRRAEDLAEQVQKTQARLIQQEKLASLGALTAGIAHEIRNPLNFVNNFAQFVVELSQELHEQLRSDPGKVLAEVGDVLADMEESAHKIQVHGKRADGVIRSMLEHSRTNKGTRQVVDFNALVEEYVSLCYHGMRAQVADFGASMECDYDPGVGGVEIVPQEIGRVLINLLNNAFYAVREKASQGNGRYVPTVRIETRRRNDAVEVRIQDNGPGIPRAIQERVFEPFFTTKPTGTGTGLGLSLSYDIVTQGYGGTILLQSDEGKHTTFILKLPISSPMSERVAM